MDILFVLDATASMRPNRDAVVKHLMGVVEMLTNMLKHSIVNVGVVAYRDFTLEPRFEVNACVVGGYDIKLLLQPQL